MDVKATFTGETEVSVSVYDIECTVCGNDMELSSAEFDSDNDLRMKAKCEHCESELDSKDENIKMLEAQVADLNDQLSNYQ